MYSYDLYEHLLVSEIKFDFLKKNNNTYSSKEPIFLLEDNDLTPISNDYSFADDIINIDTAHLYRKRLAYFRVKNGKKIYFKRFSNDVSDAEIARLVINSVMGYCLYQKKKFVLHASGISVNNVGVVFLGKSGMGKSTLSAILSSKYNFITEDVASLTYRNNKYYISQGPPIIKLSSALDFTKNKKLIQISSSKDKLNREFYKINQSNISSNYPLKKCIILDWADKIEFKKIDSTQMLANFIISTYSAFPYNSCKISSKLFMENLSRLSTVVDIYKLSRPKDSNFNEIGYLESKVFSLL